MRKSHAGCAQCCPGTCGKEWSRREPKSGEPQTWNRVPSPGLSRLKKRRGQGARIHIDSVSLSDRYTHTVAQRNQGREPLVRFREHFVVLHNRRSSLISLFRRTGDPTTPEGVIDNIKAAFAH